MRSTRAFTAAQLACAVAATAVAISAPSAPADEDPAVSATLRTIFSPRRSPAHRTMGLSQRTFLDLVEQSRPQLEVALVIDGTHSMEPALESVSNALSQMMGDLALYKEADVAYQLIIFRDVGAPSGPVDFPLGDEEHAFSSDRGAVLEAVQQISAETGAPYYPELIDHGVHQALTELPWSSGDEVTRWIFLFGDAPPFDPELHEESTGAARRVATDELIRVATERGIHVNCVLCTTRPSDQQAYDAVLDTTRAFMNALSSSTDGLMLDLSYDSIREAMLHAESVSRVEYSLIGTIDRNDVQRVRATMLAPAELVESVAVAVLPHAPLDDVRFSNDAAGTQLASELRHRLKSVPGLNVAEPLIVERRLDRLMRNPNYSGLRGEALLQALARGLQADYVLWGDVDEQQGRRHATTRLYDAATGLVVAEADRTATETVQPEQLGALLADDMLAASISTAAHRSLATHLSAVQIDPPQRAAVTRQISTAAAHDDLVAGMAALETALSYEVGDSQGKTLLEEARERLDQAAHTDDTNALPRFLLAHCLFNLAKHESADSDASKRLMKVFGRELRTAYRLRTGLPDGDVRREIEADYALLVRKRADEAIPKYRELADESAGGDAARRAHWMLAGIYSGDWAVGEEFVDANLARDRLIRILALWPNSSEARFIKRVLRWDDQEGGTRFPHFPKDNEGLAEQVDREV